MEAALRSLALGSPALAVLDGRFSPHRGPHSAALPYAVYQLISDADAHSSDGAGGLVRSRIQIDIYADEYGEARGIGRALKDAVNGFRGTHEGVAFGSVWASDVQTGYVDEDEAHRVRVDLIIWHEE